MRLSALGLLLWTLALLARVAMPMAVVEARALDPLAGAIICTHDGAVPAPSGDPGAPATDRDHCALFCCLVAPFPASPSALTALIRTPIAVLSVARREPPPPSPRIAAHRARGPPPIS